MTFSFLFPHISLCSKDHNIALESTCELPWIERFSKMFCVSNQAQGPRTLIYAERRLSILGRRGLLMLIPDWKSCMFCHQLYDAGVNVPSVGCPSWSQVRLFYVWIKVAYGEQFIKNIGLQVIFQFTFKDVHGRTITCGGVFQSLMNAPIKDSLNFII